MSFGRVLACTCRPRHASVRRTLHAAASSPVASSSSLDFVPPPPPPSSGLRKAGKKGKEKERWPGWTPVIGLELHVQLKGNIKLLSSAKAVYDDLPNVHVAHFDAALPGALPKVQPESVRLAVLACLALSSDVNPRSTFDRKHYFYVDLPSGYQVTQKYSPLATGGIVKVRHEVKGKEKLLEVRIEQIQLEQDTAKSSHDPESGTTLVDLNRAGAALIEIVSRPDMRTPEEAAAFVRHVQSVLRCVGASDANMERGELRCDVNVSVHRTSSTTPVFGNRCEIKNLNGLRFLTGAIESEVARQILDLEAGLSVAQATRGYDAVTGQTFHLRSKEDAPDYRYMPDPELGAIIITTDQLNSLRRSLPELPDEMFDRLQKEYELSARDAGVLVGLGEGEGEGVRFFEAVAKGGDGRQGRVVGNWVINELLAQLAKAEVSFQDSPVRPEDLGSLVDAVSSSRLTGTVGKTLLAAYFTSLPSLTTLSDLVTTEIARTPAPSSADLDELCQNIIRDLPEEADKVRNGQKKVLMRMVGEAMKRSGGKANAQEIMKVLGGLLEGK